MNDAIKTQISAFVDGELPANEAELLLRRMSQDKELRQQAAEYLALGRAMRGERTLAGMGALRDRIAAAIDDDSLQQDAPVAEQEGPRFLRPLAGVAIAATVALAAILGLQQVAVQSSDEDATTADTVAEVVSPGYTVPAPAEDKLREYYLRHAASSSYVGAGSINARLVTLEMPGDVLVETQPEATPVEGTEADGEDQQPQPVP